MTLTGMKKHVGRPGGGRARHHEKGRARADLQARPAPLGGSNGLIERYRQLWDARFDELDRVVEELKQKERVDGRKKRE